MANTVSVIFFKWKPRLINSISRALYLLHILILPNSHVVPISLSPSLFLSVTLSLSLAPVSLSRRPSLSLSVTPSLSLAQISLSHRHSFTFIFSVICSLCLNFFIRACLLFLQIFWIYSNDQQNQLLQ